MTTFTISLPEQVASLVETETSRQGYATRSEFIRALLRKYFSGELELEVFTPRPLEEVRQKMAKTGKYNSKFINSVTKGLSKSSAYAG